jgi:hypothetical protein
MRIAYLLNSLGMGGAERHTIALAEWMAEHGHSVLLISLLPRQTEQWPTQLEVVHLGLRKTPVSILSALFRARRVLKSFRPELVHSHTFPANMFARSFVFLVLRRRFYQQCTTSLREAARACSRIV